MPTKSELKNKKVTNVTVPLDEVLTIGDFNKLLDAFMRRNKAVEEAILAATNELRAQNKKDASDTSDEVTKKTEAEIVRLESLWGGLNDKFLSQTKLLQEKIDSVKDGKDADETTITEKATEQATNNVLELLKLPTTEDILNNITVFGERIRDSLELLQDDERLDVSAIKGLDEQLRNLQGALDKVKKQNVNIPPDARTFFIDVDISDQLDGSTKTFSIPAVYNIISVHASSFPRAFRKNIDFTYTSTTITFTDEIEAASTLAAGQTLVLTVISA